LRHETVYAVQESTEWSVGCRSVNMQNKPEGVVASWNSITIKWCYTMLDCLMLCSWYRAERLRS